MDFEKLLTEQTCSCGKTHTCNIKHVFIEPNVLEKYGSLLKNYNRALIVADQNTYEVFGRDVETAVAEKVETVCVLKREGILVPNEAAIAEMQACITKETDFKAIADFIAEKKIQLLVVGPGRKKTIP